LGLGIVIGPIPRPLAWAIESRPFGPQTQEFFVSLKETRWNSATSKAGASTSLAAVLHKSLPDNTSKAGRSLSGGEAVPLAASHELNGSETRSIRLKLSNAGRNQAIASPLSYVKSQVWQQLKRIPPGASSLHEVELNRPQIRPNPKNFPGGRQCGPVGHVWTCLDGRSDCLIENCVDSKMGSALGSQGGRLANRLLFELHFRDSLSVRFSLPGDVVCQ
jgi:hypothetical protein